MVICYELGLTLSIHTPIHMPVHMPTHMPTQILVDGLAILDDCPDQSRSHKKGRCWLWDLATG